MKQDRGGRAGMGARRGQKQRPPPSLNQPLPLFLRCFFILSASTSGRWQVSLGPVACGNKIKQLFPKQQRMQPQFGDHFPAPEWF